MSWDPHFKTLDGKHFDFMGRCAYYLMKSDEMSIVGRYEVCGKQEVTCLSSLTISTRSTVLKLGPKRKFEISNVGGKIANSRKPFCNEDLCFYQGSDLYDVVDLWSGVKLFWDRKAEVCFNLAAFLQGTTSSVSRCR